MDPVGALQDKIAIVTGGGSAVGRAICTAFAKEGARVAIVDFDESAAAAVATELESFGAQAIAIGCDVSNAGEITMAVKATVDWFGTVDILANNAQAAINDVALEDMTDADFEVAIAAGPGATLRFMRACHPHLVDGGHVINVRIGAEVIVVPDSATREWDWYGITVSSLSPAVLDDNPTDIGRVAVLLAGTDTRYTPSCQVKAESAGALVA
jgi:NAD(P)-dependent dehydrogenase (short-subunit alcohol dehydrogenase family)